MFENVLYPGMKEALEEFEASGHFLCVVTAKPRKYAWQILEHFKLSQLFRGVYGPELSQREYSKESLIHEACSNHDVIRRETVMIGDHAEDILGAKNNGLCSIGVTWGYGEREELESARPDRLVSSAGELVEYINTTLQRI
jgi:phosphoglycolate phosphatase